MARIVGMTGIPEASREALQAAIAAMKSGQRALARQHARRAVNLDPRCEEGWLILAGLADPKVGIAFARRALSINPESQRAKEAVHWFEDKLAAEKTKRPMQEELHQVTGAQTTATISRRHARPRVDVLPAKRVGKWRETWRAFRRHKAAVLGLFLVLVFLLVAIAAPILTPYDPNEGGFEHIREAPLTRFEPAPEKLEACHWSGTFLEDWGCGIFLAGTDRIGRDFFSRIIYATRTSLAVALVASLVSLAIGITFGTISGYAGGQVDEIMMRFVDFLYSLPVFLIVLGIQSFFRLFWRNQEGLLGALDTLNRNMGGLLFLFVAIGAVNWVGMARLARAMVHGQKTQDYILAARSLGASEVQIILKHLLPNIIGPLIVLETIAIPGYIFLEATLSFIGLGVHSATRGGVAGVELPSWGVMIREGYPGLRTSPYLVLLPSLALTILTVAFNFLGDGLRDAIDPRTRKRR
jgi:oligopeptide transport system permease protein